MKPTQPCLPRFPALQALFSLQKWLLIGCLQYFFYCSYWLLCLRCFDPMTPNRKTLSLNLGSTKQKICTLPPLSWAKVISTLSKQKKIERKTRQTCQSINSFGTILLFPSKSTAHGLKKKKKSFITQNKDSCLLLSYKKRVVIKTFLVCRSASSIALFTISVCFTNCMSETAWYKVRHLKIPNTLILHQVHLTNTP